MKMLMSFKNDYQVNLLAQTITENINRGHATKNMIKIVLNDLKQTANIKTLKDYNTDTIKNYTANLQERLANGEITRITTANYVTALNQIANYLQDKSLQVSAKEYNLSKQHIELVNKSVSQETHQKFLDFCQQKSEDKRNTRYIATKIAAELSRQLGLREREDVGVRKETLQNALKTNVLHLTGADGTKNSKTRDVPVTTQSQRTAIENAISYMKSQHAGYLFSDKLYTRTQAQRFLSATTTKFQKETGNKYHFHQERHTYIHEQLRQGNSEFNVARAAGHNRLEKTYTAN